MTITLSDILDKIGEGVFMTDRTGVITFANETLAGMIGLDAPEEMTGKHFSDFATAEDRPDITKAFNKAIEAESRVVDIEFSTVKKDGNQLFVQLRHCPLIEDDSIIGTAGIIRDITGTKRLEKTFVASEKKYRAIVENMGDVVYILDRTGSIQFITLSAKNLLGYEPSELVGHNIKEFTHEEDFAPALGNIENAISKRTTIENEYRIRHKNGSTIWMQTNTRPLFEADRIIAVQGSFRDITKRKHAEEALRESEEKFRSLVETTSDWIWEVDANGTYTYASPQVKHLLGYEPEEVIGRKPFDFMPPDEAARVREKFLGAAKESKPFAGVVNVNVRKNGGRLVLETSGVPRLGPRGNLLGYRGIDRDITVRKQAEDILKLSRDELELRVKERTAELEQRAEQLTRLSSELTLAEHRERSRIAKILHDHLQQLLVGARINLEILMGEIGGTSKPAIERILNLVDTSIQEMRFLNAQLAPPVLNSGDLSSSLEWLSRWMSEHQNFEVTIQSEGPIVLNRKDLAVLLFQSIRELLLNALKHSHVKSATVTLDHQDGNLRAVISDQGVGFDPGRIGEHDPTNPKFGLISIRERLHYLGGRFEIASAPNAGSVISLIIPVEKEQRTKGAPIDNRAVESSQPASPDTQRRLTGKTRVVLVDDHSVMREGLSKMLNTYPDIEIVAEASDGKEAVSLVRDIVPDVILMDVNMPNMDGLEATRIIHSDFPQVRIIGLSMYDESAQAKAMLEAGASAYRSKSGNTADLLAAIRGAG